MLINVYVASPDPDPNPRGGSQLPPNTNSAVLRKLVQRGRDANPNPNEWNWWGRSPHLYHIYWGRGSST